MTLWPRATSSLGRPSRTSPSPPVLEKGATSALTKTMVCGAPGAGDVMGEATALVEVDVEEEEIVAELLFQEGVRLDAGSALRTAGAATAARELAATATTGRAFVAAEERTVAEEEEASAIVFRLKLNRQRGEKEKK